jgi:hypothetical protein
VLVLTAKEAAKADGRVAQKTDRRRRVLRRRRR